MSPSLDDIQEAAQRIKPYVHRTPVLTNKSLNQKVGAQVYLKCENLQKVGAFKFRGACNAVSLAEVIKETGSTVVHPYNDERVIAGQGTATVELLEEVPDLDVIIAPVGGGGLISGTSVAATELKPGIRIIAGEPEMADDAYRSMQAGEIVPSVKPNTIADGLLTSLGTLTFPIIQERVEQIVTVSEQGIIASMKFIWERAKIIIEPSAAVAVGVLWEKKIDLMGLKVGVILSGGNVDLERLPWQP